MIEAVEARHVHAGHVGARSARSGVAVMFGNGESGTGGVLLGNASLGKAVGVRLGKVLSGVVWHGGLGSVSVRQSCLGTFRRGAVKFGEARSGSHGEVRHGALRFGVSGLGSQGGVSYGAVRFGAFGRG